MKATIRKCLADIGFAKPAEQLSGCANLDEEFRQIKKTYFRNILRCHPDKGGDAAEFRKLQAAFQTIREVFEKRKVKSFVGEWHSANKDDDEEEEWDGVRETWTSFFAKNPSETTADFGFYEAAAEEPVPRYRVEYARSNRSKCVATKKRRPCTKCTPTSIIPEGAVRIGMIDRKSGRHARWSRLACWIVPSEVWLGLPYTQPKMDLESEQASARETAIGSVDFEKVEMALLRMNEVILCGFSDLEPEDRRAFCLHVMNRNHWAQYRKPRKKFAIETDQKVETRTTTVVQETDETLAASIPSSSAVPRGPTDVVPRVSTQDLATGKKKFGCTRPAPEALLGQRVVLTGVFPELGGGGGLSMGKDRAKALVEAAGGKVTSAVSGKTNLLLVGREPGFSKVSKARQRGEAISLVTLADLEPVLEGARPLKELQDFRRENVLRLEDGGYSKGYKDWIKLEASKEEMDVASGRRAPLQQIAAPKTKRSSTPKPKKTKAGTKKATKSAKGKKESKPRMPKKRRASNMEKEASSTVVKQGAKHKVPRKPSRASINPIIYLE